MEDFINITMIVINSVGVYIWKYTDDLLFDDSRIVHGNVYFVCDEDVTVDMEC